MKVYQDQFGMVNPVPQTLFVCGQAPISAGALFAHCANGKNSVTADEWSSIVKPLILAHGYECEINVTPYKGVLNYKNEDSGLHDKIELLQLSAKITKLLRGAGIETVQQLDKKTDAELLRLDGLGRHAMYEIKSALLKWYKKVTE